MRLLHADLRVEDAGAAAAAVLTGKVDDKRDGEDHRSKPLVIASIGRSATVDCDMRCPSVY